MTSSIPVSPAHRPVRPDRKFLLMRQSNRPGALAEVKADETTSIADEFAMRRVGDGTWIASVDASWRTWSGPQGGVVGALCIEAAQGVAPGLAVRVMDLRFLGQPQLGELRLNTSVFEVGRKSRIVDVTVVQSSRPVASATVTLGESSQRAAIRDCLAPAVPSTTALEDSAVFEIPRDLLPFGQHAEIRSTGGALPGDEAAEARMQAWVSIIPSFPLTASSLSIVADTMPPAIFATLTAPIPIATVAMSMHLTDDSSSSTGSHILVDTWNVSLSGGWAIEDSEMRDDTGRLLATSRQSRKVLRTYDSRETYVHGGRRRRDPKGGGRASAALATQSPCAARNRSTRLDRTCPI
ncbi:thioesterase family protein [Rhodococcus sp. WS4]|nr:thioesterase family protein [Rhodococcus sp. WS4]